MLALAQDVGHGFLAAQTRRQSAQLAVLLQPRPDARDAVAGLLGVTLQFGVELLVA